MRNYLGSKAVSGTFQNIITIVKVCLVSLMLNCTSPVVHAGVSFSSLSISGPDWSDSKGWNKPEYYSTIRYVDVNGDDLLDICGRSPSGIQCHLHDTWADQFSETISGPDWSDSKGWNKPEYYSTIQYVDINDDFFTDICGRSPSGIQCHLNDAGTGQFSDAISGPELSDSKGWNKSEYYSTIQYVDINSDNFPDICSRSFSNIGTIECYLNTTRTSGTTQFSSQAISGPSLTGVYGLSYYSYYSTVRYVDIDNNFFPDVCSRSFLGIGIECHLNMTVFPSSTVQFSSSAISVPGSSDSDSDSSSWDKPEYYFTIQYVDINGDNLPEICGRSSSGIQCYLNTRTSSSAVQFSSSVIHGPDWFDSDINGWNKPEYYSTIQYVDINGDFYKDICSRSPLGIQCYLNERTLSTVQFSSRVISGPGWSDNRGWSKPEYYSTIQYVDINDDYFLDICGRSSSGIRCYLNTSTRK